MGMLGWKGAGLVKSPRLQPSHSSTDTRIISSHPKVYSFFIIIIYYYFPKKILLEMPLCAVTQGYLHSVTHLPLPRCGEKMIRSAQRRSWMPTPASPLPGLMRRYQERGFDSSAHYNKELRVTPAAGNIEMRRPQF